jgi:hypothetical protein
VIWRKYMTPAQKRRSNEEFERWDPTIRQYLVGTAHLSEEDARAWNARQGVQLMDLANTTAASNKPLEFQIEIFEWVNAVFVPPMTNLAGQAGPRATAHNDKVSIFQCHYPAITAARNERRASERFRTSRKLSTTITAAAMRADIEVLRFVCARWLQLWPVKDFACPDGSLLEILPVALNAARSGGFYHEVLKWVHEEAADSRRPRELFYNVALGVCALLIRAVTSPFSSVIRL